MAITEISNPTNGLDPNAAPLPPTDDPFQAPEVAVAILALQDKLGRSRVREALLLSVMVHLFAIIAVSTMPQWMPGGYKVALINPSDMFKNQDQTFLALPPDLQKPTAKPRPDAPLSDKNRIAESRHPELNRKDLQKIIEQSRPGPPGPPAQQQQMASASPPAAPAPPQGNGGQQQSPQFPQQPQQQARLEAPTDAGQGRGNNPFASSMSAGSAIQQAARATANGHGSGGGAGGDFGVGPRSNANVQGGLEVLSDTQGVDFGPYLERVVFIVKRNWYNVIPEAAMPPILKKGRVSIEFAILKDGRIAGMRLAGQSGDVSLDRAAWSGITASNPFPPLPTQFNGQYLALRFHFFYNPDERDLH
jgi:TonB family protein